MGITSSKPPPVSNVYQTIKILNSHKKEFSLIGLHESDVGHLYGTFAAIDLDSSLEIELDEFLSYIKTENTHFTQEIFRIFDCNHNTKMDPYEFIVSLWNFCTMSHNNIAMFVFELYDNDDSGYLDKIEMERILKDTYGADFDSSPTAKKFLSKIEEKGRKSMTAEYFLQLTKKNSAVLYPAYVLQSKIREEVVGDLFWTRLTAKREDMFGSTYIPVDIILQYHGNKKEISLHYSKREKKRDIKRQKTKEEAALAAAEIDVVGYNQKRRVSVLTKLYTGSQTVGRRMSQLIKTKEKGLYKKGQGSPPKKSSSKGKV